VTTSRMTFPASTAPEQPQDLLKRLDGSLIGLPALAPLSDARYLETHGIYEGRSNQQDLIIDWFGDHAASTVRSGESFRVLSVGCGSGILDCAILARLLDQTDDLHYVGVDPNQIECSAFEQRAEDTVLDRARVEIVRTSFEDFDAERRFDLVYFVHSLYYMPDPTAALEKARKLLRPGGRLVVFHAPCQALNELTVRFWDKHSVCPTLFAEDFAKILDGWRWAYERERVEARLEVTPLADADSSIGLALRDFIVQYDSLGLPEAVQDIVGRYLRAVSVRDRGETYIAHPVDVFIIDE